MASVAAVSREQKINRKLHMLLGDRLREVKLSKGQVEPTREQLHKAVSLDDLLHESMVDQVKAYALGFAKQYFDAGEAEFAEALLQAYSTARQKVGLMDDARTLELRKQILERKRERGRSDISRRKVASAKASVYETQGPDSVLQSLNRMSLSSTPRAPTRLSSSATPRPQPPHTSAQGEERPPSSDDGGSATPIGGIGGRRCSVGRSHEPPGLHTPSTSAGPTNSPRGPLQSPTGCTPGTLNDKASASSRKSTAYNLASPGGDSLPNRGTPPPRQMQAYTDQLAPVPAPDTKGRGREWNAQLEDYKKRAAQLRREADAMVEALPPRCRHSMPPETPPARGVVRNPSPAPDPLQPEPWMYRYLLSDIATVPKTRDGDTQQWELTLETEGDAARFVVPLRLFPCASPAAVDVLCKALTKGGAKALSFQSASQSELVLGLKETTDPDEATVKRLAEESKRLPHDADFLVTLRPPARGVGAALALSSGEQGGDRRPSHPFGEQGVVIGRVQLCQYEPDGGAMQTLAGQTLADCCARASGPDPPKFREISLKQQPIHS